MIKQEITLIKLGGSIITDKAKPYTFNPEAVRRLAREIKKANVPIILFHGSGSFGHSSAKKYGGKQGYKSTWGISKVSRDAMEINRLVMDILIEEKLPAVSLRPMSLILTKEGKIQKNNFEIILELLSQGIIPVMYGDVIWDTKWRSTIYSGEKLLVAISEYLLKAKFPIKKIIEVGNTDGVYDDKGNTVKEVTREIYKKMKKNMGTNKYDVTGGMAHKIEESLRISKKGIKTFIINGSKRNNLLKLLKDQSIEFTVIK